MWVNYNGDRLNLDNAIWLTVTTGPPFKVRVSPVYGAGFNFGPDFATEQEASDFIRDLLGARQL